MMMSLTNYNSPGTRHQINVLSETFFVKITSLLSSNTYQMCQAMKCKISLKTLTSCVVLVNDWLS